MTLMSSIEEFQINMNRIVELIEECKAEATQLPDVAASEMSVKAQAIADLCAEGMKSFESAVALADEIQTIAGQ